MRTGGRIAGVVVLCAAIIGTLSGTATAQAATRTWDGGGADANWTTPANWAGDVAPVAGDALVFPAGAARLTNTNNYPADTAFDSLSFTGPNYVIGGATIVTDSISTTAAGIKLNTPVRLPSGLVDLTVAVQGIDSVEPLLELGGSVDLDPGGGITFTGTGSSAVSGVISGTGDLERNGDGTTTLTALNTYSGVTRVVGGRLHVLGSQPGSPVGLQGGTLAGSGTVGQVSSEPPSSGTPSGVIEPGVGTGRLTIAGGLTLTPESGVHFEINGRQPGVDHDQLVVEGSVYLGSPQFSASVDFDPAPLEELVIIANDGTDPVGGTFAGLPDESFFTVDGHAFFITYAGGDGNDVSLVNGRLPVITTGAGANGQADVSVFLPGGNLVSNFTPYPGYFGAVNVALGDLDRDGLDEIITAPGAGGGPHVKIYSPDGGLIGEFLAYAAAFRGGVSVAAGDTNGDGFEEIITGAGPGGGPHVRVFDFDGTPHGGGFMAYSPAYTGGVFVAAGDVGPITGDEIVTGTNVGGGPHVRSFTAEGIEQGGFMAYAPAFTGGVRVAVGDVNGDNVGDIITGAGPGGGPHVRSFTRSGAPLVASFMAYAPSFGGGVWVGAIDFGTDVETPIVTGPGAGGPHVRVWAPDGEELDGFMAHPPPFGDGGIRVAGGGA